MQWILAGPEDGAGLHLVERLKENLKGSDACRFVPAGGGTEAYAAALGESGWDALVYLPPLLRGAFDRPDLADAEAFFTACRRAVEAAGRPARLVLLSSAAAIDPTHFNPGYLSETYRPPGRNPIARAWLDLEALAAARLPETLERIVLRPAPMISRDGTDFFSRLLRGRSAVVPAGYDPSLQLLSPDDLAGAVLAALERGGGKPGVYHVAPAGVVPVRAALRLAGVRRIPLLAGNAPAAQLDYLRHNWTVSGRKIAAELGFTPAHTSAEAVLEAFDATGAPCPELDPYGLDTGYVAAYGRTLFRFLHDAYWRIEHQGIENVPRQGPAVLTGVHRGFMPWDGVMAVHLLRRETGRIPRFLIHPCLIKFPFLANYMTKLGGLLACQENAAWVLGQGEILGMFPEGIHGAFTMYRDAYRLGRFGRDEYVKMALRHRAPIVPFVTVGSAEIYPILARIDSRLVRRVAEWPYLPVTPTFPFPGLPLPSKWHTRFLEPVPVHEMHPPEAADDPAIVRALSAEVRGRMEAAIREMLARRKSIFFGSIFKAEAGVPEPRRGTAL
jgi:1-acyl-sn-glycerol-3-phosphate acyltransferase/nucleoside-diphosphate-sugar epimerase